MISVWRAAAEVAPGSDDTAFNPYAFVTDPRQIQTAKMQVRLFEDLSHSPPFRASTGEVFASRKAAIANRIFESIGLKPLPQRVDLDIHQSEPLEHPWCTIRKLHYQIWPGIYSEALLYEPKSARRTPGPAMLSLAGHWPNGKADVNEQKRCLNLARLGYVVLAPDDNHYEDLPIGISDQTVMVWGNIRALDVLGSLPGVDKARIGACGGSGGGYQAQMLLALDDRIQAATIMGFTCDYRETIFPHVAAHTCLHYPGALKIANMPEVSTLGMPVPVQYLIMDDYTKNFRANAFPAIQSLYKQNGVAERVECCYWPTEHVYDKPKREATYRWMQRWLGEKSEADAVVEEPETTAFPVPRLLALETGVATKAREMKHLTALYEAAHRYAVPTIAAPEQWRTYRDRSAVTLQELLGADKVVPVEPPAVPATSITQVSGVSVETIDLAVEGRFRIPVTILKPASPGRFRPQIICSGKGRMGLLPPAERSPERALAASGRMVVVPDLRFFGDVSLDNLIGVGPTSLMTFVPAYAQDDWLCNQDRSFRYHIRRAWERNSIIWGRPLVGMMVTDIQRLVDYLHERPDVDASELEIVGTASTEDSDYFVPLAVLLAAAIDDRLKQIDVDLGGRSFEKRTLPPVPFVLWHGDVLQWTACAADRRLTLRNAPGTAADIAWLRGVFARQGITGSLELVAKP